MALEYLVQDLHERCIFVKPDPAIQWGEVTLGVVVLFVSRGMGDYVRPITNSAGWVGRVIQGA